MNTVNTATFSREKALRFGWDTFRKDIFFWSGLALFVVLVQSSSMLTEQYLKDQLGQYMILVQAFSWFWQAVVGMGLVRVTLNVVDGKTADTRDFFSCFQFFLRYLVASLAFGMLVVLGLLLFIVPGIFIGIKLQFYEYFIIDKNMGIADSFVSSAKTTRGLVPELFILAVIILALNVVGFFTLGIGILVTVPISKIAITHVYRQLVPAEPQP